MSKISWVVKGIKIKFSRVSMHLHRQVDASPQALEILDKRLWVAVDAHPATIHKHLGRLRAEDVSAIRVNRRRGCIRAAWGASRGASGTSGMLEGAVSSKLSMVHSSRKSRIRCEEEPTETYLNRGAFVSRCVVLCDTVTRCSYGKDAYVIKERFLTRPHAWPSGVSAGHTMPQCVLCS